MPLSAKHSIYNADINRILSLMVEYHDPEALKPPPAVGDTVSFMDNHIPQIKEGTYTLKVDQKTNQAGGLQIRSQIQDFHISGPRFQINPQDILSVFPPAGSDGDHGHVLPHIAFKRISLPWEVERAEMSFLNGNKTDTGSPKNKEGFDIDSWLVLLSFSDSEIPKITTETLEDLGMADEFNSKSKQVNTIEVATTLVNGLFPFPKELSFLAHIRQKMDSTDGDKVVDEKAYVVGNRLPASNTTSVVHLVSLKDFPKAKATGNTKFISLYNWTFSCTSRPSFKGIIDKLDARELRLYDQEEKIANPYFLNGFVPMPHFIRRGLHTLSWYRSPLLPGLQSIKFPVAEKTVAAPNIELNYSADHYLQFDDRSKMLQVSYAAAWQVGRMLTLKNKNAALAIQKTKRKIAQTIKSANLQNGDHLNFNFFNEQHQVSFRNQVNESITALKKIGTDDEILPSSIPQFDATVSNWLEKLITLDAVPFNYLVPNPLMLPSESLRFFVLDVNWTMALLEGALSVGGNERFNLSTPKYAEGTVFSGFLLRSEIVGDYPDLQVMAYAKNSPNVEEKNGIAPIFKKQLSIEVLFCLFAIETKDAPSPAVPIQTVDFSIKKEALHLGFEYTGGQLGKKIRNPKTGIQHGNALPVDKYVSTKNRTLDIMGLNDLLGVTNAHQFALQMMEGVPKVRFVKG